MGGRRTLARSASCCRSSCSSPSRIACRATASTGEQRHRQQGLSTSCCGSALGGLLWGPTSPARSQSRGARERAEVRAPTCKPQHTSLKRGPVQTGQWRDVTCMDGEALLWARPPKAPPVEPCRRARGSEGSRRRAGQWGRRSAWTARDACHWTEMGRPPP